MFSHAYMLGSMFFHVYVLSFYLFTCMFLCLYVQIYASTCLYAWIHVLPCLCVKFPHIYTHVSMPLCLDLCFHMLVRSMPCLCAQIQAMFVMPCAIVPLLSLCLSFLCFGLLVRTRSRPYGLCHCPYTKAHIKRVWIIPIFMFMLACFYALCLYQLLQFQALPCLMPPQRVCGCVVTSNAHEALFGCNHLGCIAMMPVASCIPFPFRFVQCYAYHVCSRHSLAFYASLHACSHVHA